MKKLTSFLLATVAALMLTTSVLAHGFGVNVGVGHNFVGVGVGHNFGYGYHNAFAVRAFTFAQPIYASGFAYFNAPTFALVAQPPVATVTYAAPAPCQPVQAVQAVEAVADPAPTVTYAAPAPVVTYAAPTYTVNLFGVAPGYTVGSYGYGFGVRRFAEFELHGHRRLARVDVAVAGGNTVVQEKIVRRGPLGRVREVKTITKVR